MSSAMANLGPEVGQKMRVSVVKLVLRMKNRTALYSIRWMRHFGQIAVYLCLRDYLTMTPIHL